MTISEGDLLSAGELASAARRTQGWLEEVFCGVERDTPPTADSVCNALLGSWLCDHLVHRDAAALFPVLAPRAWKLLKAQRNPPYFAPVPPALKLIIAVLMKAEGLTIEYLEDFMRQSADVLERSSADHSIEGLGHMEKEVLLHYAGLCREPASVELDQVSSFADSLSLTASADDVEVFLLYVEGWTAWGTRSVSLSKSEAWLEEMLRGFAVHFFRVYNLSMGCKLLRALCHVGASSATKELAEFVMLQQQGTGAFGFLGPEKAELECLAPGVNANLKLHLPITVQCLWALSEASTGDWRLFSRLPYVGAGEVQSQARK
jgi:hypothetical protein